MGKNDKKLSKRLAPIIKFIKKIGKPFKIFVYIGRYFKGAWTELKQVRWPNRRATWNLTMAVIFFTLFFVILIILLDAGFKELFKIIL